MQLLAEPVIRQIIRRTAALLAQHPAEFDQRPLVLPNGSFFPDLFTGDADSVQRILSRMQHHSGMTDIPIQLRLIDPDGNESGRAHDDTDQEKSQCCGEHGDCGKDGECCGEHGGGCGKDGECCGGEHCDDHRQAEANAPSAGGCCGGGCGMPEAPDPDIPRLIDLGDEWRLQVPSLELSHPVVLTTNLARALGHIFLMETQQSDRPIAEPVEVTADIAASLLGFGPLLLCGSHIYQKSCGGPRIGRVTALGCSELALITALFMARNGHDGSGLPRVLEATQRDAVTQFRRWVRARPALIDALRQNPEKLARGEIDLSEARTSVWRRWFGLGARDEKIQDDETAELDELERALLNSPVAAQSKGTSAGSSPSDDLGSLVEEALAEPMASQQ